jgi:Predicted secreted protein
VRESLSRRTFLKSSALAVATLAASAGAAAAAPLLRGPDNEPDEEVKKVLREKFGTRAIREGHVTLDVPDVAPDSREVPLLIESDLPMTADNYVKGIHVIVDHNPDIYLAGFQFHGSDRCRHARHPHQDAPQLTRPNHRGDEQG